MAMRPDLVYGARGIVAAAAERRVVARAAR